MRCIKGPGMWIIKDSRRCEYKYDGKTCVRAYCSSRKCASKVTIILDLLPSDHGELCAFDGNTAPQTQSKQSRQKINFIPQSHNREVMNLWNTAKFNNIFNWKAKQSSSKRKRVSNVLRHTRHTPDLNMLTFAIGREQPWYLYQGIIRPHMEQQMLAWICGFTQTDAMLVFPQIH